MVYALKLSHIDLVYMGYTDPLSSLKEEIIIEVRFMVPFSDGVKFKIRSRFINDFGLSPVVQKDFNRTVLFAIVDYEKFGVFDALLNR